MGAGAILAERLIKEHGVEFLEFTPDRAHFSNHGNLCDTFLVKELWGGRLTTICPWRWGGRQGYEIALQRECPVRYLARVPRLKVELDNSFSGYGIGLAVSDADWHFGKRYGRGALASPALKEGEER